MTEPARPAAPPAASTFQKGNSPAGVASCVCWSVGQAWRRLVGDTQDGSLVDKVRGRWQVRDRWRAAHVTNSGFHIRRGEQHNAAAVGCTHH